MGNTWKVSLLGMIMVLTSGCQLGGVAHIVYYEPTVPTLPKPEQATSDIGQIVTPYRARHGVEYYSNHRAQRNGTRSISLAYPRYALTVFSTQGKYAGGVGFYPFPMSAIADGGSLLDEVQLRFQCKDRDGCIVDPSRAHVLIEGQPAPVEAYCRVSWQDGRAREEPSGSWHLPFLVLLRIDCAPRVANPYPLSYALVLTNALITPAGKSDGLIIVMRRGELSDPFTGFF